MPTKDDDDASAPPAAPPTSADPDGAAAEGSPELSDEDEALLRELGQWLHEREHEDTTAIDLVVGPLPAPLTAAELEARVAALLRSRRRSLLRVIASHFAVAAAAVALLRLWPTSPEPQAPAEPPIAYELDLRGGEAKTLARPARVPVYTPGSTLDFKLRASRIVEGRPEVVIRACREDESCDRGAVLVVLEIEPHEIHEQVIHVREQAGDVLPLAAGRWILTFEVGAEGSCLVAVPEHPCVEAGHHAVEIAVEPDDAP